MKANVDMQSSDISEALESWYRRHSGDELGASIRQRLQPILDLAFGYHVMQMGPLSSHRLVDGSPINHRIYVSDCGAPDLSLQCHGDELPIESDSIDMLVAFHALEFDEHPHGCLREMQRVLRPHGHLVIVGFNPRSLLGVSQLVRGLVGGGALWANHRPVSVHRLTDWLHLLDCEMESVHHLYPIPLAGSGRVRRMIAATDEWASRHGVPAGGLYIAHAVKQIAGLRRPRRLTLAPRARLVGLSVAASPQAAPRAPGRANTAARNDAARPPTRLRSV